jgi:predicted ArsR family transcriptional regulator
VLQEMIDAGRPVHVSELAEVFPIHHTAIRQHLARLVEAGLVAQTSTPPRGRGRPRLAYSATPDAAAALQPRQGYLELASMLAEAIQDGDGTRASGRRIGRRVALRHRNKDAVAVIIDEAERLGFDPAPAAGSGRRVDVELRHCPYQDVAAQAPETICQLHLGLAEGVADELGGVAVLGMDVRDPYVAGCRLQLERRPRSA